MMNKGVIKTYFIERWSGVIAAKDGTELRFSTNSIICRERKSLKKDDEVLYESRLVRGHPRAINIRKCRAA